MRAASDSSWTPVVLVHVPKTGGTTLRRIIEREYGAGRVLSLDEPGARDAIAEHRPLAVVGHAPVGLHGTLDVPVRYVTLVRDPVARVASHYHHVRRTPDAPGHEDVRRLSLEEYVTRSPWARWVNDAQTRYLAGVPDALRDLGPRELENAKRNADELFAVVGVTERFAESVLLMREALGWHSWPSHVRQKVRPRRERRAEVPAAARRAILERNALDAELHRWASRRFETLLERSRAASLRTVSLLRALNGVRVVEDLAARAVRKARRALAGQPRPGEAAGRST